MTEQVFLLPDLGEGLIDAEVISWLVSPGDRVEVDQPIVEVESAKAVVELPSPYGGTVTQLHAEAQSTVRRGEPLLTVFVEDPAAAKTPAPEALTDDASSGSVLVGFGTRPGKTPKRRAAGKRFGTHAPGSAQLRVPPQPVDTAVSAGKSSVISPIVRRLAASHGLDATQLTGTGRSGLVTRRDVEAIIAAHTLTATHTTAVERPQALASGETRIPFTGMRRTIADNMSESRRTIPEATVWRDVDATALLETRRALAAAFPEPVSLTGLLAKIVAQALTLHPDLNARLDAEASEIVRHGSVHLGIATHTPRGLMVPVIRDAGRKSTRELCADAAALTLGAETGRFPAELLGGGTFTLNNYGRFGVDGSAAIIHYPEAAILGIGQIVDRVWAVEGQIMIRKVAQLSLVFDHRICDGAEAAALLGHVARCIESPILVLANA